MRDDDKSEERVRQLMREVLDRLKRGEGESGDLEKEYVVTEEVLLRDLALCVDEIFDASVEPTPQGLLLVFKNGQTFMLTVREEIFQLE